MNVARRRFLQAAAATVAATSAGLFPRVGRTGDEPAEIPIVDTHQHLWDVNVVRPPWLSGKLDRSYTLADYRTAAQGLNVVKAVYMEVNVADDQLEAEADYVLGLCRRGEAPTVAAVLGGRPWDDGFSQYIDRFRDERNFKGIRRIPKLENPSVLPMPDVLIDNLRLLGRRGLCFDICVPPQALADAARLVDRCPETRFVLDHCGNADPNAFQPGATAPSHAPDSWRRDIEAMARRKNVVCKISGVVARVPSAWSPDFLAPPINHCLDSFGPDRVIFAGDWPVCTRGGATLADWVGALRQIVADRSEADRRKLFHDNAVAFYGLS